MGDFRLFEVKGGSVSTIAGLKLTNGKATGASGGAILCAGNLTVSSCAIENNSASDGGGIAAVPQTLPGGGTTKSVLTLYSTVISSNSASVGAGISVTDGDMTAQNNVQILNNTATLDGGGIAITRGDPNTSPSLNITLLDIIISGNTAGIRGGGIYTSGGITETPSNFVVNLTLDGGSIGFNTASFSHGGGVYLGPNSILTATNTPTIAYNEAPNGQGSGLYIEVGASRSGTINYVGNTEYDANEA